MWQAARGEGGHCIAPPGAQLRIVRARQRSGALGILAEKLGRSIALGAARFPDIHRCHIHGALHHAALASNSA
jgi:hypothetical protein